MELIAAVVGPVVAGTISVMLWIGKRNADQMDKSVTLIMTTMTTLEDRVEECRLEVAKNVVAQETLEIVKQDLRDHIEDSRRMHNEMTHDLREVKDMYWNLRMEVLEIKDKT